MNIGDAIITESIGGTLFSAPPSFYTQFTLLTHHSIVASNLHARNYVCHTVFIVLLCLQSFRNLLLLVSTAQRGILFTYFKSTPMKSQLSLRLQP